MTTGACRDMPILVMPPPAQRRPGQADSGSTEAAPSARSGSPTTRGVLSSSGPREECGTIVERPQVQLDG